MIYVLVFPTLLSAMSGYDGTVRAFIPDSDKRFIPFEFFQTVFYVVHDGQRVNKTDEYLVTSQDTYGMTNVQQDSWTSLTIAR